MMVIFKFPYVLLFTNSPACHSELINLAIGDAVHITTPGYPAFYSNNADCVWLFKNLNNGTFEIVVNELVFANNGDMLQVGYGSNYSDVTSEIVRLEFFVARTNRATVYIASKEMWMRFVSDDLQRHRGANLTVQRLSNIGK